MKKGMKFTGSAFILLFFMMLAPIIPVKAEETAIFKVQASEVLEDGTIRVSVYLNEISNLGGIDAELVYEPDMLTYISSGLGKGFLDGYGTTHYDADTSTIKCIAIFQKAKSTQGEIMHAVFQLNNVESYQPEFRVVNLIDSSVELNSIPYIISYQQEDGSWADIQDKSNQRADDSVIQEAKNLYASEADWEGFSSGYPEDETAGDLLKQMEEDALVGNVQENAGDNSADNADGDISENKDDKEAKKTEEAGGTKKKRKEVLEKEEKDSKVYMLVVSGFVIIVFCVVGYSFIRRKKYGK